MAERPSREPMAVQVPLSLLTSRTIMLLTDSFRTLLVTCYDEEKLRTAMAKARVVEALAAVELFPLAGDDTHEDHVPGDQ